MTKDEYQEQSPNRGPRWKKYENVWFFGLKAPGWVSGWYGFKSMVDYPFQKRIHWTNDYFTYGELLLVLPVCVIGIIAAYVLSDKIEGSGSLAGVPLGVAFATVMHNSVWTFLMGIPFERALMYHKIAAIFAAAGGVYHGLVAIGQCGDDWSGQTACEDDEGDSETEEGAFLSGYLLTGGCIAIIVFSLSILRRKLFQFFHGMHWLIVFVIVGGALLHGAGGITGGGIFLFVVDMVWRYLVLRTRFTKQARIARLPGDVVRLTFSKKNFHYQAGQYVFICIPKLTIFEWHPFSISSSPHDDEVMLHIRVLGNWTKSLYELASQPRDDSELDISIHIEGPYGNPSVDIEGERYKMFLLVSGGIGITPMQSITNDLVDQKERGREIKLIWFVWSVRDKVMIEAMLDHDKDYFRQIQEEDLPTSFQPAMVQRRSSIVGTDNPSSIEMNDYLHTEFYLTRARSPQDYADANIEPEMQRCLRFGRPDLPVIFQGMRKLAEQQGEKKVAVLTCGPGVMVSEVKKLCAKTSRNGDIEFDYHGEVFDF